MLILLFSIASINLNSFIDGLSNVEPCKNATDMEISFNITNSDTYFFFHKLNILEFVIYNNKNQIKNIKNGFRIPINSIVSISGKWDELFKKYNNTFLIGFYNGKNCDFIFYSSSANELFPLDFFPNKRKCVYHFYKDSTVSNSSSTNKKSRKALFNVNAIFQKNLDVKGVIKVNEKHPNLYEDSFEEDEEEDYGFTYSDGNASLTLGIIVNILGLLFYIIFILVYATSCDMCSSTKKAIKEKLNLYNLKNKFYYDTLQIVYKDNYKNDA